MCGIFCSLSNKHFVAPSPKDLQLLKRRGPDSCQTVQRKIHSKVEEATWYLTVSATVLSLRGDRLTEQPIEDPNSNSLFCWNGEAWTVDGKNLGGNDAQAVFDLLLGATQLAVDCHQEPPARDASLRKVADALGSIAGPFAFLYFDAYHERVFLGRDVLGRRSLLKHVEQDGCLIISSTSSHADLSTWNEVEADGIYTIDISNIPKCSNGRAIPEGREMAFEIEHIPWSIQQRTDILTLSSASPLIQLNKDIPTENVPELRLDSAAVIELGDHLKRSLGLRVHGVPTPSSAATNPARIGILFSGGLDCALLARICHDILPFDHDIDLLNVAFENPRVVKAAGKTSAESTPAHPSPYSMCPDRLTGHSTHAELLRVCPERTWRFVSIDVPYAETLAHRSEITALIYPHHTEMDLSIACALYFAARGAGTVKVAETGLTRAYTTPACVLLSGLGADEMFGGYTRHSTAFRLAGYEGLVGELELDICRLGKRNLGRDDRVISYWGKEARYPYLDEALVRWALRRPVWEKCGFRKSHIDKDHLLNAKDPILEPAKLLLRLLAWRLRMKGAAAEKKRAIQFGTRTAKMEAGRSKGTENLVADG